MNGVPGALQSRDPACAAAQVESLTLRHVKTTPWGSTVAAGDNSLTDGVVFPFQLEPAALGFKLSFIFSVLLCRSNPFLAFVRGIQTGAAVNGVPVQT